MYIQKRISNSLGVKDSYSFYKEFYESKLDSSIYGKILKECNKELLRLLTEEAEIVQLPYRLGVLYVGKYKRSFNQPNKFPVDFKKTKDNGIRIFFDQEYIYRWKWIKKNAIVKNKTRYKFRASRMAKRAIPKALSNNKDFTTFK